MERDQSSQRESLFDIHAQNHSASLPDPDFFSFLKGEQPRISSFFSKNGLSHDIIQELKAEPDISLEVFYALYNVLWPQIERQSDFSFKDAWIDFIGCSKHKGILCPPEKLIRERSFNDIKRILSEPAGEGQIFQELDQVVNSILHLKRKVIDFPGELFQREEILASFDLVEEFYKDYRNKVKSSIQEFIKKEQLDVSESYKYKDLFEPSVTMMSDNFSHHWAYRISRIYARVLKLKSMQGCINRETRKYPSNLFGRALPERQAESSVYFQLSRSYPFQPEKEFMLYSLYRHLQIPVPETALLILTDTLETDTESFSVVQASEAFNGEPADQACQSQNTIFEEKAYAEQVIGALLTNPSNGKFNSFHYSKKYKTLISIDNEFIFESELIGGDDVKDVNVKSILYLLPQMDLPIPESVKTFFKTLEPRLTIASWLHDLKEKNNGYQLLFKRLAFQKTRDIYESLRSESETPLLSTCLEKTVHMDCKHLGGSFPPQILVPDSLSKSLIDKLQIIKNTLSKIGPTSLQTLFKKLSPLGAYYQELRLEFRDPKEAFEVLMSYERSYICKNPISYLHSLGVNEIDDFCCNHFLGADCEIPDDVISSSRTVFGALMEQRTFLLTESENQYLFDQQGNIRKNASLARRSLITCFPEENPEFYLKQYPEWPGYEFASTLFMRMLGVKNLPYQDLLIINNSPVLLTQKVSGNPVSQVWHHPEAFIHLDPFQTGLLIIAAILLNPEGGKEDNFILSEDGKYLIPIGSKHCFLPSPFHSEGNFWNPLTVGAALQTRTFLFSLDQMYLTIPLEVRQRIISTNFETLLISWMTELEKLEYKFNNLIVYLGHREKFSNQGTVMSIPFYKQSLQNIYWKARKIQSCLENEKSPTPLELLRAVEPLIAKDLSLLESQINPQSRFNAKMAKLSTQTDLDERKMIILDSNTTMEIIQIPKEDLLDDSIFQRIKPAEALDIFDDFFQVKARGKRIEQRLLCELDGSEVSGLEAALKEFFTNSQVGLVFKGSRLVTSSKLKSLFVLSPNKGIEIRFLSLPKSPLLTEKEIRILVSECPKIEYLNVSGCEKLKEIVTKFEEWRFLIRLEAKECLNFERLVSYSPIRILRIETKRTLEVFAEKSSLEIFTISKKTNQFELMLKKEESFEIKSQNQTISNRDFLLNLLREEEEIHQHLRDIKVRTGKSSISTGKDLTVFISDINLQTSNIQAEDIKRMIEFQLPNLKRLELSRNKLKGTDYLEYLIQGKWPSLNHLNLSDNEVHDGGLEILVKGNWPLLEVLNLQDTKITAAGVDTLAKKTKWTQLKSIDISDNKINDKVLSTLCRENWPVLKTLNLKNTGVTKRALFNFLFTSNFKNLKEVDFGRNGKNLVNYFLQKNWTGLEELDLSDCGIAQNEMETLVNKCTWSNLKHLNLSNNDLNDEGLEIFVQGDCPKLEILNLKKTNITTIGVKAIVDHAKWAQMKHLNLSYNEIDDEELQIFSSADLPLLETLNLENTAGTKKGLLHLISNPKRANLEELNFGWNGENIAKNLIQKNWHLLEELDLSDSKISQKEVEIIVYKCNWPCLKSLNLSSNPEVNDEAVAVLCQGNWSMLETLNLENTGITKKSLLNFLLHANWSKLETLLLPKWWNDCDKKLAWSFVQKDLSQAERLDLNNLKTHFTKIEAILSKNKYLTLKYLNLSDNEISQEGKERLLGITEYHLLEELHLRNIKLSSNELETILNQSNWSHLKHLDISQNQIFDEGLPASVLAEWPFLETLNISKTNLSLQGVEAILDLSKWQQLKHLDISQNELFDEGLSTLALVNWPFLESLNLSQIKCSSKGVEALVDQSKWLQLKYLDISHNELSDEGISALTLAEWLFLKELNLKNTKITPKGLEILVKQMKLQNLKKLDISENIIGDEGLKTLTSGEWPLFEHLVYYATQVTRKGHITLLEKMKWPNLTHLEHSLNESFCDDDEKILAAVPMSYKKQSNMVMVLDVNWQNSKEIFMTIKHQDLNEKIIILPRNKLNQLESIKISFNVLPKIKALQSIIFPLNLKSLDLSKSSLSDHGDLENLVFKNCPLLEDLQLKKTNITTKGIEILFSKRNFPNLKKLDLSQNIIQNEGLEALVFASLKMLENINLEKTGRTDDSIKTLSKSNWPNLKRLNLSRNKIQDKGLEMLCSGKWPLLESLHLQSLSFTEKGIESIINKSEWPNLKILDLSFNINILDEGSESLASGKWPLLECLYLNCTNFELKVVETLVKKASWPNLKEMSLMDNIDISDHQDTIKGLVLRKWPSVKLTI